MSTIQAEIRATRTQLGYVPAAQVSRATLVELAAKAMAALEEFMAALTPVDVQPLGKIEPRSIAWAESASDDEGGNPAARERATRKNYTTTDQAARKGNPRCPECGDETVLRTRKSNGSTFYGCINYPTCAATTDAQKFSTRRGAMSGGGR